MAAHKADASIKNMPRKLLEFAALPMGDWLATMVTPRNARATPMAFVLVNFSFFSKQLIISVKIGMVASAIAPYAAVVYFKEAEKNHGNKVYNNIPKMIIGKIWWIEMCCFFNPRIRQGSRQMLAIKYR